MLTIKCTKSCPWGVHHAWGPTFQIEPDMVLTTEKWPADTNAQDWGAFLLTLLKEGQAVQIPNKEPVEAKDKEPDKEPDTTGGDDKNTGNAPGSTEVKDADNTGTSGDSENSAPGDTPENTTGDKPNGDENITGDDAEVTPETLKAELEGIALKEMDGPMGSEQKAKAFLEGVSKERYGFDVDKRMSVDNIVEAIVGAAFKAK